MSNRIEIKTDSSELDRMPGLIRSALTKALESVALILHGNMVKESPVDKGKLKGSISLPVQIDALTFGIGIGAEYWKYVQFGTKPHMIFPVNVSALKFKVGGKTVFAKSVNHPGTAANPFIDRAIDSTEPRIDDAVAYALSEVGL